jgi:hypothetical protein
MNRIIQLIPWLLCMVSPLAAAEYFVDAVQGRDKANGLSPESAWKSLERVNDTEFSAGDVIRFRNGQAFPGQLRLRSSGSSGNPIRISYYGDGPKPHIKGEGRKRAAVVLDNVSHVVVDGLEVTNTGPEPEARRVGVLVKAADAGVVRSIVLRNLTVRDVNGSISKEEGGGTGIRWEVVSRKKPSRIDGLLIEDCHVVRCDRDAIKGSMEPWTDMSFLSTNVVIRNNLLEDIGGDGIVPIGTDGTVVEYNRLYGARQRFDPTVPETSQRAGPSVGMWPWSSKNTQFRYNEVWGYRGTFDGQGFDSDYNCSGTTFEYNLSGDNAGGFFLICNWAMHQEAGRSIGNSNTLIRRNISLNDHVRSFVLNGPVSDVRIEENIIFNTIEEELPVIIDTPWGGYAESVEVIDNLFYTTGQARIFQGTWAGDGLGNWKYEGPINRETFRFSGNAYRSVADHQEPEMKQLGDDETLQSLIDRLTDDPEAPEGFGKLMNFLRESRHWDDIKAAL